MARVNKPTIDSWPTRSLILAAMIAAGSFTAGSSSAQTVIIGGSGSSPVEINMGALAPSTPVRSPSVRVYQPGNLAPLYQQDYSKGSQIVYGDEVITLVPPSLQVKKKKKIVRVAKKPATATKKQAAPKAAPTAEVKVAKIAPPEKPIKKMTPVTKQPAPAKTAAAPKPVKAAPEKVTATTAKPEVVKKQAPTVAKAAPVAEAVKKPAVQPKKKPQSVAKAIAPTAPPEKKEAEAKQADPETQVAAVAPETITQPMAKAPAANGTAAGTENQIMFEPEQSKLPSKATSQLKELASVLKTGTDRVQLVAYANANSNSAARRLSLGRALVVRSKLMELGVPNNKIEVRALGKPKDGSPADRVDLKLITR